MISIYDYTYMIDHIWYLIISYMCTHIWLSIYDTSMSHIYVHIYDWPYMIFNYIICVRTHNMIDDIWVGILILMYVWLVNDTKIPYMCTHIWSYVCTHIWVEAYDHICDRHMIIYGAGIWLHIYVYPSESYTVFLCDGGAS